MASRKPRLAIHTAARLHGQAATQVGALCLFVSTFHSNSPFIMTLIRYRLACSSIGSPRLDGSTQINIPAKSAVKFDILAKFTSPR